MFLAATAVVAAVMIAAAAVVISAAVIAAAAQTVDLAVGRAEHGAEAAAAFRFCGGGEHIQREADIFKIAAGVTGHSGGGAGFRHAAAQRTHYHIHRAEQLYDGEQADGNIDRHRGTHGSVAVGNGDGVAFAGGKAENHGLILGSHSFIDTFEEQLIGKNIGEECEVNVTFPAEYHVTDLQNKPAMFKVVVKEIKVRELPELNDDFASEVSEFDTLEEYKNNIALKLKAEKEKFAATELENRVVDKAVENATMEIPEMMINEQVNNMINDYANRLQSQGISFQQFMEITGQKVEDIAEQMKPNAIKRIETRLVLEAIVKAENIEAGEAAIDAEFEKLAENFKMDKEQVKSMFGPEQLDLMKADLAVQEAISFLVAKANLA